MRAGLLYLAVLLFTALWQGMIGVLAKWILWPPFAIVCARCIVAAVLLASLSRLGRSSLSHEHTPLARRSLAHLLVSGALLAGHWGALFWAYRIADVGPVVVAVFTFPLMSSLLEPLAYRQRPQIRQLLFALLGSIGVAVIAWNPENASADSQTGLGIVLGLGSGLCFALRGLSSRHLMNKSNAITIMAVQAFVVALLLSPSLLTVPSSLLTRDQFLLVALLGVGFTAIPHTLLVWVLGKLSVTTSGIIGSLQVVSAIVFAQALLDEHVSWSVWVGAGLVLSAVTGESLSALRRLRRGA